MTDKQQVESSPKSARFGLNRRLGLPNNADFFSIYRHNHKTVGFVAFSKKSLERWSLTNRPDYADDYADLGAILARFCLYLPHGFGVAK